MLHIFDERVYILSKFNGPYSGLNLGSIALNLSRCIGGKPRRSCSFLSRLVDPQRLDNKYIYIYIFFDLANESLTLISK